MEGAKCLVRNSKELYNKIYKLFRIAEGIKEQNIFCWANFLTLGFPLSLIWFVPAPWWPCTKEATWIGSTTSDTSLSECPVCLQQQGELSSVVSWCKAVSHSLPYLERSFHKAVSHLSLNGHEFEQALGLGNGQGSLGFCGPQGCRVDTTGWLNWTKGWQIREAGNSNKDFRKHMD